MKNIEIIIKIFNIIVILAIISDIIYYIIFKNPLASYAALIIIVGATETWEWKLVDGIKQWEQVT